MPELAEVETFRRQLEPLLSNKKIVSVELFHPRSTRRHANKKQFVQEVQGKKVNRVSRFGKYLTFELSSGKFLNVHLRMSGRFVCYAKTVFDLSKLPKHSHIIISTDEHVIVFVDPRTFGELWLTSSTTPELEKGIDAFDSSETELKEKLLDYAWSKRSIKSILLDQNILSGIGNIYADEICATSKVLPTKRLSGLSESEVLEIARSCKSVLQNAIEARGSSLRDESFRDLYGEIGKFQIQHIVHARKNCAKCGSEIIKTKISGRSTYFCESCQN